MKAAIIKNKTSLKDAQELINLREQKRTVDKRLKELTEGFKETLEMGDNLLGEYRLTMREVTRNTLDRAAIEAALGDLAPFMKASTSITIDAKRRN